MAQTLASLQANRETRRLFERARTAETAQEITGINRHLSTYLLETIVSDKKAAEEKAKELAIKTQELEAKLAEIESRTIWQKLKALFGLKR